MTEHSRRAYAVVDLFEQEIADYTGAPFAIAVNACTNALLLCYAQRLPFWAGDPPYIELPRRTYVGVLQSALNAGYEVRWHDRPWSGSYYIDPLELFDSARDLHRGMYEAGTQMCLSFHSAKQLPLGRGGAILTDNEEAAEWFRAARMDGRPPGQPLSATVFPAWHMPMPPDVAARGLDVLSRWNDAGWSPPPLPPTDYPDLSLIYRREGVKV